MSQPGTNAETDDLLAQMRKDTEPPPFSGDVSHTTELAFEQHEIKLRLKELADEKKQLQERYDELRLTLVPDAMAAAGLVGADGKGSFTTNFGQRCQLRTRVYSSVNAHDRPALYAWLEDEGLEDLIRPSVNHQTLSATVREFLEDGKPIPDFVKVHTETSAVLVSS